MEFFVQQDSIVRQIWGKGDTVLFIFAGASAEFALNNAVDWLYFTGRLPADPLGRLFSTVAYARKIVFSEKDDALRAIDQIKNIHTSIENARGKSIPDWAYRDVLFMLIHYSIASYEVLERKLSDQEKEDVYQAFYRLGSRMEINGLPANYKKWVVMRDDHLKKDLQYSKFTADLYKQYRKHLGPVRYLLLKEGQKLVAPERVNHLLNLGKLSLLTPVLFFYKLSRKIKLDWFLKSIVLPAEYKQQIKDLDLIPS